MIWDLYQQYQIDQLDKRVDRIDDQLADEAVGRRAAVRLDDKVNRLALICRAMFELLQQSSAVTEEQLKAKIVEIDVRDGHADGVMTPPQKRCPKCNAMMSPQFGRCLFCGYRDEMAVSF